LQDFTQKDFRREFSSLEANMKTRFSLKLTFAVLFTLSLLSCSNTVSPDASDEISSTVDVHTSSAQGYSSESSSSSAPKTTTNQDTAKVTDIQESPFDSIVIERPVVFEAPSISAVIFQWDTTVAQYEFKVVVDGNYSTYAIMESQNMDSLVYQFKWNDEDPSAWTQIKISLKQDTTNSVNYITHAERIIDGVKNLCVSYASARLIWWGTHTDSQGKDIHDTIFTEWANPVGPLYTFTESNDARTTYATGLYGTDPCRK